MTPQHTILSSPPPLTTLFCAAPPPGPMLIERAAVTETAGASATPAITSPTPAGNYLESVRPAVDSDARPSASAARRRWPGRWIALPPTTGGVREAGCTEAGSTTVHSHTATTLHHWETDQACHSATQQTADTRKLNKTCMSFSTSVIAKRDHSSQKYIAKDTKYNGTYRGTHLTGY